MPDPKPNSLSEDNSPTSETWRTDYRAQLIRATKLGISLGLTVGLLILGGVFIVVRQCLPFYISLPAQPWPWYCSDQIYRGIGFMAFPGNLLTNDLGRAILFAPLSLLLYVLLGAVLGLVIGLFRSSVSRS